LRKTFRVRDTNEIRLGPGPRVMLAFPVLRAQLTLKFAQTAETAEKVGSALSEGL